MYLYNIGKEGERTAKEYLKKTGLIFLEANYHILGAEIDLIMKDENRNEFVFVEVRTRSGDSFGKAEDSLSPHKRQVLRRGIIAYMQKLPWTTDYRFDFVTVTKQNEAWKINHIKYAELI